jgi:hypothetical protein
VKSLLLTKNEREKAGRDPEGCGAGEEDEGRGEGLILLSFSKTPARAAILNDIWLRSGFTGHHSKMEKGAKSGWVPWCTCVWGEGSAWKERERGV